MQIQDDELREIFAAECAEHIQSINDGLLILEQRPLDETTLAEVFREAHSIKGAARMVGVEDMEFLAHRFEDVLGQAKRGDLLLDPAIIDRLYLGLDAMRLLAQEAVSGEAAGVDVDAVAGALLGQVAPGPPVGAAPEPEPEPEPIVEVESETGTDDGAGPVAGEEDGAGRESYRIETIRVKPEQLDKLMTQAGELTVAKIRIGGRIRQVDEIIEAWEALGEILQAKAKAKTRAGGRRLEAGGDGLAARRERFGVLLDSLKKTTAEDLARLDLIAGKLEEGIRSVRLLPLSTVFNLYPRMIRDLARKLGKQVEFRVEGGETTADKRILEEIKDPLMHLLRNAVDHGIESDAERGRIGKPLPARLLLRARRTSSNLVVEVMDDGAGLDLAAIQRQALAKKIRRREELSAMSEEQVQGLVFAPGFSTSAFVTDVSGRGVGLDVVRTNVERLKGGIRVVSTPGEGCRFEMHFPLTLATTRVLIAELGGFKYAVPVEFVRRGLKVDREAVFLVEGRPTVMVDGHAVSVVDLAAILELRQGAEAGLNNRRRLDKLLCIVIELGNERMGLFVDALVDEQEVVLKPNNGLLKRVRNVSGATILGTGEVCMVLNPADMLQSLRRGAGGDHFHQQVENMEATRQAILLVEDSITTRTQEKRILEGAGYEVVVAVDGLDGYAKLGTRPFDAVITDVEMPNMSGLELAEKIRLDERYRELPIILVTSLASEEDQKRGVEAGANAYITKGRFEQKVLLDTLGRLI